MIEDLKRYLDKLGLEEKAEIIYDANSDKDVLFVNLGTSNRFAQVYTLLENADWLELVDGDLSLQNEYSNLLYINDDVAFALKADLINDVYSLEVEEL